MPGRPQTPGALGFFLGLAANNISERLTLYRAHRAARRLAGEWVAHDYEPGNNRSIDPRPMPGAGLTVISARPWWSKSSHILDVHAQDVDSGQVRNHHGYLAIDPIRPQRATRTIFYVDSDEIAEQRVEISDDDNTLHLFDESADGGYSKETALRRRMNPVSAYTELNGLRTRRRGNAARSKERGGLPVCSSPLCPCLFRALLSLASCRSGASVAERHLGCPRFGSGTDCRYRRHSSTIRSFRVLASRCAHSSTVRQLCVG